MYIKPDLVWILKYDLNKKNQYRQRLKLHSHYQILMNYLDNDFVFNIFGGSGKDFIIRQFDKVINGEVIQSGIGTDMMLDITIDGACTVIIEDYPEISSRGVVTCDTIELRNLLYDYATNYLEPLAIGKKREKNAPTFAMPSIEQHGGQELYYHIESKAFRPWSEVAKDWE